MKLILASEVAKASGIEVKIVRQVLIGMVGMGVLQGVTITPFGKPFEEASDVAFKLAAGGNDGE